MNDSNANPVRCPACKKFFEADEIRPIPWWCSLPLQIAGVREDEEAGEVHFSFCDRCRRRQTILAAIFCVMAVIAGIAYICERF